jgi:hypothetical protein
MQGIIPVFERKKHIKLPNDIMFSACMFMKYWAGLYPDESQSAIEAGVEIIMKTAINVMKSQEVQRAPRRITGDAGRGDVLGGDQPEEGEAIQRE